MHSAMHSFCQSECKRSRVLQYHYSMHLCTCSDVICEFPLKEMLAFHKERGAEGTLLVTKVGSFPVSGLRRCDRRSWHFQWGC